MRLIQFSKSPPCSPTYFSAAFPSMLGAGRNVNLPGCSRMCSRTLSLFLTFPFYLLYHHAAESRCSLVSESSVGIISSAFTDGYQMATDLSLALSSRFACFLSFVWNKGRFEHRVCVYLSIASRCENMSQMCIQASLGSDFQSSNVQAGPKQALGLQISCHDGALLCCTALMHHN